MTSPGLSSELGAFQFSGSCFARVHWSLHRGGWSIDYIIVLVSGR
jgi:hypothetical protein